MAERRFIVTKEEEAFLLGRFEGESVSGVFLTPEYLGRLRQIRNAVGARLEAIGNREMPDALKNLLGVIDKMTIAHANQAKAENYGGSKADREDIARIEQDLAELQRQLDSFPKGPSGPRKK